MNTYVLSVGIDRYLHPIINNLNGCENDVYLINKTLQNRFNIPDENIKVLLSTEATKSAIVKSLQSHFLQAKKGDVVLFYFSGHGSQEPATSEFWNIDPDKQLETLVCHDSEVNGVTQLANKELRYLISQLDPELSQVVIIVDSCHSGHINRTLFTSRQTSITNQPRRLEDFIFYDDAKKNNWLSRLDDIPQGKSILLSACRNTELSQERDINGVHQGVFTYALCKTLNSLSCPQSYYNLFTRVRPLVRKYNRHQTPQIESTKEADVDQLFIQGDQLRPVDFTIYQRNNIWWMDAGIVHGLNIGDKIAVFAPDDAESNSPIAIAKILEAEAGRCRLTDDDNYQDSTSINLYDLKGTLFYPVKIIHRNIAKLCFLMEGEKANIEKLRAELSVLNGGQSPSEFIEENKNSLDYRVRAKNGEFTIGDAAERIYRPLFVAVSSAKEVLQQLEHLKRWEQKLELDNGVSGVSTDSIQLVIRNSGTGEEFVDQNVILQYEYMNDRGPEPKISFEVRCNPNSMLSKPQYCALLLFDSVTARVSADLNEEVLNPSEDIGTCRAAYLEGKAIPFSVNDTLFELGVTETVDYVKLIVSDTPFDAKLLAQKGLKIFKSSYRGDENRQANNLENLLNQAMNYSHTRSFSFSSAPYVPQWFTKTFEIKTIRPNQSVKVSQIKAVNLSSKVSIQAHPSLVANVKLSTASEGLTRSFKGREQSANIIPPIFRNDDVTPPYSFSTTRDIVTDLSVLDIEFSDGNCLDEVTVEQPLNITVDQPLNKNEQILPYAYDGEFYLPLGRAVSTDADKTHIIIERLPKFKAEVEGLTNKGLGNSIKVFFQRVVYNNLVIGSDPTYLAIPEFDNNNPVKVVAHNSDEQHLKQKIKSANKILLLIHGIMGETRTMLGAVNYSSDNGESLSDNYLVLSFDYESLNTSIEDIAQSLKEKLDAVGLGKGHGKQLDIVAHCMGGLVSRWFIEKEGGENIVNTLIMLGTPNKGTPLAEIKDRGSNLINDWANNTLAALINGFITNGAGNLAVTGLMKLIDSMDNTLDQMHPESRLIGILENTDRPKTAYYMIAGNTGLIKKSADDIKATLFKKMLGHMKLIGYRQLTNILYKNKNDTFTSVDSVFLSMGDENSKVVACDHLGYFDNKQSLGELTKALLNSEG